MVPWSSNLCSCALNAQLDATHLNESFATVMEFGNHTDWSSEKTYQTVEMNNLSKVMQVTCSQPRHCMHVRLPTAFSPIPSCTTVCLCLFGCQGLQAPTHLLKPVNTPLHMVDIMREMQLLRSDVLLALTRHTHQMIRLSSTGINKLLLPMLPSLQGGVERKLPRMLEEYRQSVSAAASYAQGSLCMPWCTMNGHACLTAPLAAAWSPCGCVLALTHR